MYTSKHHDNIIKHLKPIPIMWVSVDVSLVTPLPLWVPRVIGGGQGGGTHHHTTLEKALQSFLIEVDIFVYELIFAHALNLGFSSFVSTCTGVKSRMNPKILWSSRLGPVLKMKRLMINFEPTKHNATISFKFVKEGRSFFWIRITFQNEKEN